VLVLQNLFADYLFAHNVPRVLDELLNDVMQDMPDDPYAKLVCPSTAPRTYASRQLALQYIVVAHNVSGVRCGFTGGTAQEEG
jgi:hypothetical protein